MPTKIVVTGSTGIMGSCLTVRLAAEGNEVVGVDIRGRTPTPAGVRHVQVDIRDTTAMRRILDGAHAVVHCATALPSYPAPEIRSTIVDGTRSVLSAADDAKVERFIHTSSTAVYGLPDLVPTPESYGHHPVDSYGQAKAEAEAHCMQFRDKGRCITILRPKTFLGEGRMGIFAMLFDWAEGGHNFPLLGGGRVRNQMLSTDDLIDAVLLSLAADQDVANDTYNIAAAEFSTLREDFQAVLDRSGHGKRILSIPTKPAVLVLERLDRAGLSPVYKRLIHKLLSDSWADITHAQHRLRFAPRHSGTDALLMAYEWYLAQRHRNHMQTIKGITSDTAWHQGALRLAKVLF